MLKSPSQEFKDRVIVAGLDPMLLNTQIQMSTFTSAEAGNSPPKFQDIRKFVYNAVNTKASSFTLDLLDNWEHEVSVAIFSSCVFVFLCGVWLGWKDNSESNSQQLERGKAPKLSHSTENSWHGESVGEL